MDISQREDLYFNNFVNQGYIKRMTSAFNDYQRSGKMNAVQAPQLLKQWIGIGGDEETVKDKNNDPMVSSFVIAKKLANYLAKKETEAEASGDTAIAQTAREQVSSALQSLSNYDKDNNEGFSQVLGQVAGFDKELNYTTFGEQTDYDIGMQESTSAIGRIAQQVGDMSLVGAAKRGITGNRLDEIDRAISNELVRTGAVDQGIIEQAAGIGLGIVAGAIESGILSKFGGSAAKSVMTKKLGKLASELKPEQIQSYENIGQAVARYGAQGALLPVVQSLQDQAGLTEKYDSGSGYMKLLGDAMQNTGSMIIGDAITAPLLKYVQMKGMTKLADKYSLSNVDKIIKETSKEAGDIKKAIIEAVDIKDPGMLDKYIKESLGGTVTDETKRMFAESLGSNLKKAVYATKLNEVFKPTALFAGEFASDIAFDMLTTTAMAGLNENLVTVHQKAMYNIPDVLEGSDWQQAIATTALQRLGMKIGGHLVSKGQQKIADIRYGKGSEPTGTAKWLGEQIGEKPTMMQSVLSRYNNFIMGNDFADMDNFIKARHPEMDINSFMSTDGNGLKAVVASWMYNKYANNAIALSFGDRIMRTEETSKGLGNILDNLLMKHNLIIQMANGLNETVGSVTPSFIQANSDEAIKIANKIADDIANKVSVGTTWDDQKNLSKVLLNADNMDEVKRQYWTAIKGFSFEDAQATKDFVTTLANRFKENIYGKAMKQMPEGKAFDYSMIEGREDFELKGEARVKLDSDSYARHSDLLMGYIKDLPVVKGMNRDQAMEAYKQIGLVKNGIDDAAYKSAMDEFRKSKHFMPKSVVLDMKNIEDMEEIIRKNYVEGLEGDDAWKNLNTIRGLMEKVQKETFKTYVNKILEIKNKAGNEKPNMNDSSQATAYVLRLLNLAQRVNVDDDSKNLVIRLKDDPWINSAVKMALGKNGMIGKMTGFTEIAEALGGDKSFDEVVTRLVNMSTNVKIGRRAFTSSMINTRQIETILSAMNGSSSQDRAINWMVDFVQNNTSEIGRLGNLTVNGEDFGHSVVTNHSYVVKAILNGELSSIAQKDLDMSYGLTTAKKFIRESFTSYNPEIDGNDFFKYLSRNPSIVVSEKDGRVFINVNTDTESRKNKANFISKNAIGVIKTVLKEEDFKTFMSGRNSTFDFVNGDPLNVKEIYDKLKFKTSDNIDIEEAVLHIVKVNAYDRDKAIGELKKFFTKVDTSIDPENNSFNSFLNVIYKENASINAWHATVEVADPLKPYMRDMTITYSNQQMYLDAIEGLHIINLNLNEKFMLESGTSYDNIKVNQAKEALAKKGIHAVTQKGNTMEWMFVHIPETNDDGSIPIEVMKRMLNARLKMSSNTNLNEQKVKAIDELLHKIESMEGSINAETFIKTILEDYRSIMESEYKEADIKEVKESSVKKNKAEELFFDSDEVKNLNKYINEYIGETILQATSTKEEFNALFDQITKGQISGTGISSEIIAEKLRQIMPEIQKRSERTLARSIMDLYKKHHAFLGEYKGDLASILIKGYEKTGKNIKAYKETIDKLSTRSMQQEELLKFVMFGDALIAEKGLITKRSSYSNYSPYLTAEGEWINNDIKNVFIEMANNHPVYFASLGGDGDCCAPRVVLDKLSIVSGNTLGKLVSNTGNGGFKFNFAYTERLKDVIDLDKIVFTSQDGTVIQTGRQSGMLKDQLDNAIVIDVTAYKTMMPGLMEVLESNKGNTFAKMTGITPDKMAKFIASMTLHSAIETSAKKKGEFGYAVDTPMHELNSVQARSHVLRAAQVMGKDFELKPEDIIDPTKFAGTIRKKMSIAENNISASAKAETWKELGLLDSKTIDEEDMQALKNLFKGEDAIFADAHVSSDIIRSLMVNAKNLVDSNNKGKMKAYAKFWNSMTDNPDDMINNIDSFRNGKWDDDLSKRQTTLTMQGEWKDGIGFVVSDPKEIERLKVITDSKDYYETNSQGLFINKKYSIVKDGKVNKELSYKALMDNMGKESLNILSDGPKAPLQKYTVGGRNIIMANLTRFPNQKIGQNFNVVISGIHTRSYGMEIDDYYYQKILGGDYDGDAVQLIGLSSDNYRQALSDIKGDEKNDEDTLIFMRDMYVEAILAEYNNPPQPISPSEYHGSYTQPGSFIAMLYEMQRIDSFFKVNGNNDRNCVKDVWQERLTGEEGIYRETVEGKETKTRVLDVSDWLNTDDNGRKIVFFMADSAYNGVEISHTLSNAIMSPSKDIGSNTFRVMLAEDAAKTNIAYLVRYVKEGDFITPDVVSQIPIPASIQTRMFDINSRISIANTLMESESKKITEFLTSNKEFGGNYSKYNEGRNQFEGRMSFTSKQMITDAANGIGVDNMKNNTLVYFLNKLATSKNPNAMQDFISKIGIASNLSSIAQMYANNKTYFKVGQNDISAKKDINFKGFMDSVVNKFRKVIDEGTAGYDFLSKDSFDKVKKLLTSVPDQGEFIDGFRALHGALHHGGTGNRDSFVQAKLPMFYQILIKRFESMLKSKSFGGSEIVQMVKWKIDSELYSKLFGDNKLDMFMASKSLLKSDVLSSDELAKLTDEQKKEVAIKNPLAVIFNFEAMEDLLKQYHLGLFDDGDIAKSFKIMANQNSWIKLNAIDKDQVYSVLSMKMKESTGRVFDKQDIVDLMGLMELSVKDATDKMLGIDFLVDHISEFRGEEDPKELAKKLKEFQKKNRTGVYGFNILLRGKETSVETLARELSSKLKKSISDREKTLKADEVQALSKALISLMDKDQQRTIGFLSNGISSKVVGKIGIQLTSTDVKDIFDEQKSFMELKKLNVLEQAEIVADEMLNRKVSGVCE